MREAKKVASEGGVAVVERVGRGREARRAAGGSTGGKRRRQRQQRQQRTKKERIYIGRSSRSWAAVGEKRDSWIEKGRRYWKRKTPVRGRPRRRHGGQGRVRETAEVGVKNPTRN